MNATQATTEKLNVTQEKLPQSQIRLKIEIPGSKSQSIYENVVQNLSRTVNIPGFRKGKIPRHVLLQRLGKEALKGSTLEKLVQTATEQAIEQESITAIGNYQLESPFEELIKEFEPGQDFIFNITVDTPPEINIGDYSNLKIQAEEVIFDAQKVDTYLEEQRRKESTLVPIEGRPAIMGDVAIIDYQGRFTDVPEGENANIPGGDATDFEMELSAGRFIQEIMDGVIGMNIGDTKEIEVNFPSDYSAPPLAGKHTIFTVTLKSLKEKEFPALNDDFAQEISDCETMDELRELITTRFKEQAEDKTKTNKEEALVKELAKLVEAEFPETIIQQEVNNMLTQSAMQMEQMGFDIKSMFTESRIAELRELSRPEAIAKLK
ncbi:MAG TPA: trigger factor, partial [Allocoleopsis sp.]